MADLAIQFPPFISYGAVGGPRFKTSVAVMANGAESRAQEWELERGEWTVSHHARKAADWEPLLAFFRVVAGMANTFRFKDWTDFECANGAGFFVTSGSSKQMVKRYTYGAYTYDRVITKPISGHITTDAVGLSYTTGLATSGTTWYGEFDCWARLNSDPMRCQVISRSAGQLVVGWDDIEIVEVTGEVT